MGLNKLSGHAHRAEFRNLKIVVVIVTMGVIVLWGYHGDA